MNFQRARELSLSGDHVGMMKEITSQLGTQAEFEALNVIQRKAIADSIGVSVADLAKMVGKEKEALSLAGTLSSMDPWENLAGEDALTSFAQMTNQLKSIGVALANEIGPPLMNFIKGLTSVVKWLNEGVGVGN